jgi:hypothetical protein
MSGDGWSAGWTVYGTFGADLCYFHFIRVALLWMLELDSWMPHYALTDKVARRSLLS